MKKLILITTPLLLASCTQNMPPLQPMPTQTMTAASSPASLPAEAARQGQYLALPGQSAIDTDAAFEQQVATYASQGATVATPAQNVAYQGGVVSVAAPAEAGNAAPVPAPTVVPTAPAGTGVIVNPVQSAAPAGSPYAVTPAYDQMAAGAAAIAGGAAGAVLPGAAPAPVLGPVDYTLRITNATPGRIFVEAQDAAGEIYPCGFMTGSQSISSVKKQVNPIQGPITVVVRDPDKPDAPELRRYKVDPPTGYAGKTVEITIISGGLYQVSVDGQVRYITPTPVGKPDLGTHAPAAPATPAPAAETPAPATTPAPAEPAPAPVPAEPAPEPLPAGI